MSYIAYIKINNQRKAKPADHKQKEITQPNVTGSNE